MGKLRLGEFWGVWAPPHSQPGYRDTWETADPPLSREGAPGTEHNQLAPWDLSPISAWPLALGPCEEAVVSCVPRSSPFGNGCIPGATSPQRGWQPACLSHAHVQHPPPPSRTEPQCPGPISVKAPAPPKREGSCAPEPWSWQGPAADFPSALCQLAEPRRCPAGAGLGLLQELHRQPVLG